jgi:3-deoxy-D-manno-octulosonate 8-phosphate phosphatase (KDO 8-P phosphatase)
MAAAEGDAHPLIKKHAHSICRKNGGQGAFREFVEFIIAAQKKWGTIMSRFKFIFDRKI